MNVDCLDYRQLPPQNPIFLSLLYDYDRIRHFLLPPDFSSDAVEERVRYVHDKDGLTRNLLVGPLEAFNRSLGAGTKTLANIEKLGHPDTVAIVTGQQVGLFGGPSYAIYKAASAIQIARKFEEMGHPAVPVFWLAADDSDFDEVCSASFIDQKDGVRTLQLPDRRTSEDQMVGTVRLDGIEALLDEYRESLQGAEFADETLSLLRNSYRSDREFRTAFGAWIAELFSDYGLVVFNSLTPEYRPALRDFFSTAVQKRETIVRGLLHRTQALESSGLPAQVKVDESESLLFLVDGNRRHKLVFENGRFRSKTGKQRQFTEVELLRLIDESPETIGANVLLRPILQDFLLPTAVYVGGPAEIAYFAQLTSVSHHWGIRPLIVPRAGFTIVDRKSQRLMQKYGLDPRSLMCQSRHELKERILREDESQSLLGEFERLRGDLNDRLGALRDQLAGLDPTVREMLENSSRKVFYHLDRVQNRFIDNQEVRQPHLKRHLDHLQNRIVPDSHLQERVLNFNQFLAEEGRRLIDVVLEAAVGDCPSHRILYL